MFVLQSPSNLGKRERTTDNGEHMSNGFSQHRNKRQMSSLPVRHLPESRKRSLLSINSASAPVISQTRQSTTLTPNDSDEEDSKGKDDQGAYSATWTETLTQTSNPSINFNMQQAQISPYPRVYSPPPEESPTFSDDMDIDGHDQFLQSPGPMHPDTPTNINARIPTPINAQFEQFVRRPAITKSNRPSAISMNDYTSYSGLLQYQRRLPSPISEGEDSPSMILGNLSAMQMDTHDGEFEVDDQSLPTGGKPTYDGFGPREAVNQELNLQSSITRPAELVSVSPKKFDLLSKHNVRSWDGGEIDNGREILEGPVKKTFSMGYRADCEKCRSKIPGHYSHIILG